jgi:hypothetical protein
MYKSYGEKKYAHKDFVWNPQVQSALGSARFKLGGIVKVDLTETG